MPLLYPVACGALLFAQSSVADLEALARQRLAARDAGGALAAYQKLAALVPKSAVYQDQIGFLLAATNRSAEAIPHFQRATELDPKMAQAWFHLGAAAVAGAAGRCRCQRAAESRGARPRAMANIASAWEPSTTKPGTTRRPPANWRIAGAATAREREGLGDARQSPTSGSIFTSRRATLTGRPSNSIRRTTWFATDYANALVRSGDPPRVCGNFAAFSRAIRTMCACR